MMVSYSVLKEVGKRNVKFRCSGTLRDVVFEGNVIVKVGPPALVTHVGLILTFSTIVASKLG